MRRSLAFTALALLSAPLRAEESSFIGEQGGYRHPATEASDYLESDARRDIPPAKPLKENLARPLEMTPQKTREAGDDEARAGGERDYDANILGLRPPERRDDALHPAVPVDDGRLGKLFVSVHIDSTRAPLKDALADLAAVRFSPDARFPPAPLAHGFVAVRGWMPASGLGRAVGVSGVTKVEVDQGSRQLAPPRTMARYRVSLLARPGVEARDLVGDALDKLSAAADFKLRRIVGIRDVPGASARILDMEGDLPISRLDRALAQPDVVELGPAAAAPVHPAPSQTPSGFLSWVLGHSPWLVLATGLLLAATLGRLFVY